MQQSTPLDNIIIILIMVIITNPVVIKEGWPRAWQCSKHFTRHVKSLSPHSNSEVGTVIPHFSDEKTQAQ